jgi:hypothetical protein
VAALRGKGRVVLVGAGLGVGLLALEAGELRLGLSGLTALVSLVPVAVSLALGGPAAGVLAGAIAVSGAAATLGGTAAAVVAARHVLPGLALGVVLTRRWHLAAGLAAVTAVSLIGLVGLVWAYMPSGEGPLTLLGRQIDARLGEVERFSSRLPLGTDAAWAAESARLVVGAMRIAGPAVVLMGLLVVSLTNYLGARLCLRGQRFRAFAEEAVPDHLVWAVIVGGAMFVSRQEPVERFGLNLLIVLAALYAIQGLAVLRHFFQKARIPRPLQGVSFGLFAVQPLLLVAAACLGLSDLWVDFRKIRQAPTPA